MGWKFSMLPSNLTIFKQTNCTCLQSPVYNIKLPNDQHESTCICIWCQVSMYDQLNWIPAGGQGQWKYQEPERRKHSIRTTVYTIVESEQACIHLIPIQLQFVRHRSKLNQTWFWVGSFSRIYPWATELHVVILITPRFIMSVLA